jgi:signal peptidase II
MPAWRCPRAVAVFTLAALIGTVADLVSKWQAFACLTDSPDRGATVIPGFLRLSLSVNAGIVFGLPVPPWLVLSATALAVAAVTVLFARSASRFWLLHAALGMVLGGAIGNAYDRVTLGRVRDFIDVFVGERHWPTFNVADALLVVGVGLIFIHLLKHPEKH